MKETVIAEDECALFVQGKLEPEDPPPSDFYVALNNGALCDPHSSHRMDIEFLGAETIPFIIVPLNDPDEAEV